MFYFSTFIGENIVLSNFIKEHMKGLDKELSEDLMKGMCFHGFVIFFFLSVVINFHVN